MKAIVPLYSLTAFLASFLLFTAEPMIGKMVLPTFGGTPAVWNTCLLFFQLVLLEGYAISAPGVGFVRSRRRRLLAAPYLVPIAFLMVVAWGSLPLAPDPGLLGPSNEPATRLFWSLATKVMLPLLMAASAAPLVQNWFAATGHPRALDPYFLYSASNAGSFLGLLAYPLAIEPSLALAAQSRLWSVGFYVLTVLLLGSALLARRLSRAVAEADEVEESRSELLSSPYPSVATVLEWLVLVFVPSSWMMGVTTYLTTDLAPMPLLWVIPLAFYLLTFIVAFSAPDSTVVRLAAAILPACVLALALVLSAGFVHAIWIPLHLLAFFAGALACHGALARRRPPAPQLSSFYIAIATGGLLGGVFNAILAPVLFDRVVEYPLAIIAGCWLATGLDHLARRPRARELAGAVWLPGVVFGLTAVLVTNTTNLGDSVWGVLAVIVASGLAFYAMVRVRVQPFRFALTAGAVIAASGLTQGVNGRLLHIERNFFGVVRVTEDAGHNVHRLFHGSTLHGQQGLDPQSAREPSTYFTRSGPIGQLFDTIGPRIEEPGSHIAIVGLGAGTLAAYARAGQRWTFYEIDPAIERIARDPRYFTYLRDCGADSLDVVLGDARLRLREAPERSYRLIILDAFSSDSLPVHLVTREAIRLYLSRLAEGGVLAFNLSNRYLDLAPLMARQADDAGLACRIRYDVVVSPEERQAGKQPSIWAVMAAGDDDLGAIATDSRWLVPEPRPGARAWTDDYSDLTRYLRWMPPRLRIRPVEKGADR